MLSIIIPSIRESVIKCVSSIDTSVAENYELIIVGPNKPSIKRDFIFIEDYGSPSRCLQRGILASSGDIFTWGTDDGIYRINALQECLDLLRTKTHKDGVIVKYTEEGPFSNLNGSVNDYYLCKSHRDSRQPGTDPDWKMAPLGMYYKAYWESLGGFDCGVHHINMNTHDFAFRLQKDGGQLYFSPNVVLHCNSNNFGADHKILDDAYHTVDLPMFKQWYKDSLRPIKIDVNNWTLSPERWERFK